MEIKNNQILLIESSLNEIHKIIHDKDTKILQLQKDKNSLKDTLVNHRYELESTNDENEKLKKQIKILFETQNDLKKEIQDKELEIKSLETSKRQDEKLLQTKNNSLIQSMEERIFEANDFIKEKENHIKEINSKNDYLQNVIELKKNEEDLLKYDNVNLRKQIKLLKENIEEKEQKIKKYEYKEILITSNTKEEDTDILEKNKKLRNFEKKFKDTKKNTPTEEIEDEESKISPLTEEDILKNSLGL